MVCGRNNRRCCRSPPHHLSEILHPQISPKANPDQIAKGIGASPGAATGRIVFSASAAQACGARGEACILVRVETAPDDIRAMHSANGILTERGGITSHAAVVARGFGVPCVVGVSDLSIDVRSKTITLKNGEVLKVGDVLTIEGSSGQIFRDAPPLVEPELGGAFYEFMSWADEFRRLGVRCNADTAQEVRLAKTFGIDGLGLVRTEHMFLGRPPFNHDARADFRHHGYRAIGGVGFAPPHTAKGFLRYIRADGLCPRVYSPA